MIKRCYKCDIATYRKNIVNGYGNTKSSIMFIGEAPGYQEDKQGIPFVGDSGKLLIKLLNEIGFSRKDVYITNIIKCRPQGNRNPTNIEINNCLPYLSREIKTINPKIIVLLGGVATCSYFKKDYLPISKIRGKVLKVGKRVIIATFHPSYGLRNKEGLVKIRKDFDVIYQTYIDKVNMFHEK